MNNKNQMVKHYLTFKEKLIIAYVCIERKILLSLRFKISALFSWIGMFVSLATFFFLGKLIQPGVTVYISQYGSGAYFPYVLLGMAFGTLSGLALTLYLNVISSTYWSNWLEMIFSSPMGFRTYMGITMVWVYFTSALTIIIYFLVGIFIFGAELTLPSTWWLAIIVLALAILAISGFGLISASMFLLADVKGGVEPISWAVATCAAILSGVVFPPEIFLDTAPSLYYISRLLPHTYALDAFRRIMLNDEGLSPIVTSEILKLIAFIVVFLPLGAYMFKKGLEKAERTGKLARWG